MMVLNYNKLSKVEVDAMKECIDLCRNGYSMIVEWQDKEYKYFKLRHNRSGRVLQLHIYPDHYHLKCDGKILKSVKA